MKSLALIAILLLSSVATVFAAEAESIDSILAGGGDSGVCSIDGKGCRK